MRYVFVLVLATELTVPPCFFLIEHPQMFGNLTPMNKFSNSERCINICPLIYNIPHQSV